MKKLFIILIGLIFFASCGKNIITYGEVEYPDMSKAIVKINMASMYPDNRFMFVKFNDVRVTPNIQGRQPYPGGGYNTYGDSRPDFLTADPGKLNIKVCMASKIDPLKDSLLYEVSYDVQGGKSYTIHVADTSQNTKSMLQEEFFVMPDSGYASYKFVNLMPDVEYVDLYYGQSATSHVADVLVASNIKFMSSSENFTLNRYMTRTWKVRRAGTGTTGTVLASYVNAGAILNQRQYTAYALGYESSFGKTPARTNRPFVSFFLVR